MTADCWTFASWNVGGIHAKLRDIDVRTRLSAIDVVLLQETQTIRDFTLPSHDAWLLPGTRPDGPGRPSGGLALLTKKTANWTLQKLSDNSCSHFQAGILSSGEVS
jgi:exonuclease III